MAEAAQCTAIRRRNFVAACEFARRIGGGVNFECSTPEDAAIVLAVTDTILYARRKCERAFKIKCCDDYDYDDDDNDDASSFWRAVITAEEHRAAATTMLRHDAATTCAATGMLITDSDDAVTLEVRSSSNYAARKFVVWRPAMIVVKQVVSFANPLRYAVAMSHLTAEELWEVYYRCEKQVDDVFARNATADA